MTDELDAVLAEHPWLRPRLGLWTRPGWRPIVASALREIVSIASESGVDVHIEQVKEKFGKLKTMSTP